jgi:GDP-L-fucose synthase
MAADHSNADVKFDPNKPSMLPIRKINTSLANEEFGWSAKTSLEVGIRKTVEWYRSYYKNASPEERR